ncbi:MAG: beta-lactamase family protein [Acidobacteria bacterium]|nr:beta-lactamase family protein [Acidobacteriota bacterium]MYH30852.1 beta-lactamase family protein [Acidobacteriota bacterium]MYK87688.1 beta-lactamase family protein [Acidobacteriota bacterium]
MREAVTRWRLAYLPAAFAAVGMLSTSFLTAAPMAAERAAAAPATAERAAARDLETVDPSAVGVSAKRLERLTAGMQGMVDDGRLAGVVTLMARGGKLVHAHVAGVQDVESGAPMERDSIFRIYSMTKPITGVALMMLYEEGKWRLNDPVSRFIPGFADLKVHDGDRANGEPRLVDAERPMTMAELMSHAGGLGYGLGTANHVDRLYREQRVLNADEPLQAMIDKLSNLPLLAQPGTRWYYSIGVDVQGYLVEEISGQPFAEFLQERIFDPLGMVDTAFYVPEEKLDRVALIYGEGDDGGLERFDMGPTRTGMPAGPSGGGGLWGTADDYLRFTQMLLNGGELEGVRLLAPRTVEMMATNFLSPEALETMRPGQGFGLDFATVHDPAAAGEPYAKGTYYWGGAAGTWFWIDPRTDLTFVGMIQHRGAAVREVQGISRNLVYQAVVD